MILHKLIYVMIIYRYSSIVDTLMFQTDLIATLFPYTTLFRSAADQRHPAGRCDVRRGAAGAVAPGGRRVSRTRPIAVVSYSARSEEHTSELQSRLHLVCRLLLEKKKIC